MKCIILAAGYATRMYPLTENFPKPLLAIKGKPILDWLMDDINKCGISEFIVVTNHKFYDQFVEWANGHDKGISIKVVDDGTTTNEKRLGAVKDIVLGVQADGTRDDYLVIAGDNILEFSFEGFIKFFEAKGAPCVMCYEENDLKKQQRTAIITFEADGLITTYEEKPSEPKGNHAVPPFYCYRAADIDRIEEALANGCGYDAPGSFAAWLSKHENVYAWEMPGKRIDIGTIEGYEAMK